MTSDRLLRIGGWAALLVAIAAPIAFVVLIVAGDHSAPVGGPLVAAIDVVRLVALLVAVLGLDRLFRRFAPEAATPIRVAGAVGSVALIVIEAAVAAGLDVGVVGDLLGVAGSALVGAWFIAGGAVLMREGDGLLRIGWTAELGGVGTILTAIALAIPLTGPGGGALAWSEWFGILALFSIVYLVRVWMYVVRGRLPAPGIL